MSVFDHVKTFQRWCAAVVSDYEVVISQFLAADGFEFDVFKKKLLNCGTLFLHHCAVGKGKSMSEQYERITRILIQTAKDFWLRFPMAEMLANIDSDEFMMARVSNSKLKTMIAGLYLTYSMIHTCTTLKAKPKIWLDSQDLFAFFYFKKCFVESDIPDFVKIQVEYFLIQLSLQDAFEFCSESQQTGINPNIRHYRNVVDGNVSKMIHAVKDVQNTFVLPCRANEIIDEMRIVETEKAKIKKMSLMALSAVQDFADMNAELNESLTDNGKKDAQMKETKASESFQISETNNDNGNIKVAAAKNDDESQALVGRNGDSTHSHSNHFKESLLNMDDGSSKLTHFVNATSLCSALNDTPVLSTPNLLANVIVDRAMMCEARKRAQRSMKKRTLGSGNDANQIQREDTEGVPIRKSEPYIEEGGIFSRKVVNEENERIPGQNPSYTDTAESAKNFWDYINTGVYGGIEEKVSPTPLSSYSGNKNSEAEAAAGSSGTSASNSQFKTAK